MRVKYVMLMMVLVLLIGCADPVDRLAPIGSSSVDMIIRGDSTDDLNEDLGTSEVDSMSDDEEDIGPMSDDPSDRGDMGVTEAGVIDAGDTLEDPPSTSNTVSEELMFSLIIRQTHQSCSGCGIWFDWQEQQANKPRLVVKYERDGDQHTVEYQHGLQGMDNAHAIWIQTGRAHDESNKHQMLIKQGPRRNGLFRVNVSDIPIDATIVEAKLHLHLNNHEGLANADRTSTLMVHECTRDWDWNSVSWTHASTGEPWASAGGDFGREIREIHAGRDMHDRGFNKARPDGFFDFTSFMQTLQSERGVSDPEGG